MQERSGNEAIREQPCVECERVDTPITIWPGPGWLAVLLWGASVAGWLLGTVTGSVTIGYITAAVFLAALIYTLWYFYRREKACRHCRAPWRPRPTGIAGP